MKKISIIAVLVLAISMILIPSMCFANAVGSYSLSGVWVSMTEPTSGSLAPTDLNAGTKINVENITWKDSTGKVLSATDKISGGTYTLSFDLIRNAGDSFAGRTSIYINNSAEGVNKEFVNANKMSVSKEFSFRATSSGRLSNASGKAQYMEGGEASTATTSDGKKILGLVNILIDGEVTEGKALPSTFQLKTDLDTTFKKYSISQSASSDSSVPYAVWQQFDETAKADTSYTVRYVIPLGSDVEAADKMTILVDGKNYPKTGLFGNIFVDVTYKTGEKKSAELYQTVSKVEFEDYVFPVAGQELNAQDVKLKAGFPGKIESANYIMFQRTMEGTATKGENMALDIRVELNDGYKFSSPDAYLNGQKQDTKIHNDDMGDGLYGFVWNYTIPESSTVKIVDQSPETVEFHEGDKVELFVKIEGEGTIEWTEVTATTSGGGAKQKFDRTVVIEGANADKYIIEKATKDMDGHQYGVRVTAPDKSVAYGKAMVLKFTEKAVDEGKAEDPVAKTSGEVKASGDVKTEEAKVEETKPEEKEVETKPEEVVKITWAEASKWAIEELSKANEEGLIPSIFDKQSLKVNITRKEFAHVAVKLYEKLTGKKAEAVSKNPFKDTKDVEILKAYKLEITNGISDTEFAPDALITREQMATMMARALTAAGIDTKVDLTKVKEFADDNEMHNWSRSAIYFMSNIEIIKGMGDNRFGVKENASREQSIIISVRSATKFSSAK